MNIVFTDIISYEGGFSQEQEKEAVDFFRSNGQGDGKKSSCLFL